MTIDNTPSHTFLPLTTCPLDSRLVNITHPEKPVIYGNCDLFKALYGEGSIKVMLALKRPQILGDSSAQAELVKRRFQREATIWSRLNHINILPFYGIVELVLETSSVAEAYLASPWVESGDLSEFLAARLKCLDASAPERACAAFSTFDENLMIRGIASGLAYLHGHGVIHRDLKAANILLSVSIEPLICDFSLTKNEEFNVTSETQKHCGTGRWKCPTLEEGNPRTNTDFLSSL
ncbi:hypothetical protein FRB93_011045 [Tulasnella sp. JGI-2019a]|nr:hypothetical protein FRB93_011045 [Tulasnella sp. JGI-2019a]